MAGKEQQACLPNPSALLTDSQPLGRRQLPSGTHGVLRKDGSAVRTSLVMQESRLHPSSGSVSSFVRKCL